MRLLTLKTILIATDLDEASVLAVEAARMLATTAGGTLHVAYATRGDASTSDVRRWLTEHAHIDLDEPSSTGSRPSHQRQPSADSPSTSART